MKTIKIKKESKSEVERYKEMIDEDLKTFLINKRFVQLEKSWIQHISHQIMRSGHSFTHKDRVKLRKELLKHLNSKITPKIKQSEDWE